LNEPFLNVNIWWLNPKPYDHLIRNYTSVT